MSCHRAALRSPTPCPSDCGVGGGLYLAYMDDPQSVGPCGVVPTFWNYSHGITLDIVDCVFRGNAATCPTCSGGGVAATNGGKVTMVNCSLEGNSAGLFGGGECGVLDTLFAAPTLDLWLLSFPLLLVLAGACWCLLVLAGACWCLLVLAACCSCPDCSCCSCRSCC